MLMATDDLLLAAQALVNLGVVTGSPPNKGGIAFAGRPGTVVLLTWWGC
jgi:hypothetical protein